MKLFLCALLSLCSNVACVTHLRLPGSTGLRQTGLVADVSSSGKEHLRQQVAAVVQKKSAPPLKMTLNNHNGVQYTAPVVLGGQELQAIYDSGSFEVMAISKDCSICKLHEAQVAYDSSSSKSFKKGSKGVEDHHFAGGMVKAREDYETVHVGSAGTGIKVKDMPFWQVSETNMQVFLNKKANFTGIVGMGHRNHRPDSDSESLIERAGITKFSICLEPGLANPGYLTFNPALNLADPGFGKLTVVGEKHWAVEMEHVQTDLFGTPLHACWTYANQNPCVAVIDSGTSLIGVPPDATTMVKTLIKRIKYDCSNLGELPDLVFTLDGKRFALPARAYTVHFGMENGKPSRCLPAFTDVSMSLKGANVWILGLPFLRHFYTVFDREGPSIYVADQAANCEPALGKKTALIAGGVPPHEPQLPTIADLSQATLPVWAFGNQDA